MVEKGFLDRGIILVKYRGRKYFWSSVFFDGDEVNVER